MIMIWKCLSSISHFVYKCINYSNFHFFSFLSLLLFIRTKKKIFKEKRKRRRTTTIWNVHWWQRTGQGRAHRVTNLIPSSNQSMCARMPDAKENNSTDIRVAWSFRIYWTRLKTWTNVRSQSSDLVCVCNRCEPQGHLSCHTNAQMTFS
jgi:hypothetical protein